jgi:hypothetical protein
MYLHDAPSSAVALGLPKIQKLLDRLAKQHPKNARTQFLVCTGMIEQNGRCWRAVLGTKFASHYQNEVNVIGFTHIRNIASENNNTI